MPDFAEQPKFSQSWDRQKMEERERARERERAGIQPKPRMNARRFTAEELAERKRERSRTLYRRIMADPDRYARYAEARHRYYEKNKEKFCEYRNQWRKKHKRRTMIQRRLYNDRRRMRCRESPEFYQHHLMLQRMAYYRRRAKLGVTRNLVPRMNRRTPIGCTFDRVLDTRSVFLWNNNVAASIVAGREFKQMQWREIHCDRFGRVCR